MYSVCTQTPNHSAPLSERDLTSPLSLWNMRAQREQWTLPPPLNRSKMLFIPPNPASQTPLALFTLGPSSIPPFSTSSTLRWRRSHSRNIFSIEGCLKFPKGPNGYGLGEKFDLVGVCCDFRSGKMCRWGFIEMDFFGGVYARTCSMIRPTG